MIELIVFFSQELYNMYLYRIEYYNSGGWGGFDIRLKNECTINVLTIYQFINLVFYSCV